MEYLILIGLSVPVFYIVGLIVFIRWIARGGHGADASARYKAAAEVRAAALGQSPKVVESLMRVAGQLDGTGIGAPAGTSPATFVASDHHASGSDEAVIHPGTTARWAVPPVPAPAPAKGLNADLGSLAHSMDNINVLLYLGAFLVVVSAGIFVGYNFETLTGVFKTVFLAAFAAAFYAVGLILFLTSTRLRPAGVTFTGIGLVLLPLVGLAAYNFTYLHDHGPATWFVTSLITLVAYIVTLVVTRQTYIAYLMAFTTLSLFEASIALIDLPPYWFGWGMAAVAILLLAFSRTRLFWEDARSSLMVSANIFVPVALLISLLSVVDFELSQLGVTLGLAAAFYAAMAIRFMGKSIADTYFVLSLISLPAALAVGLWDALSRGNVALILLAVGAVYLAAEHFATGRLSPRWRQLLALVTGLLPFAGLIVMYDSPEAIAAILAAAVLINGDLAWRLKQSSLGLLAILSLLALPFVVVRGVLDPTPAWSMVSLGLLLAVPVLVWWARRMRGWAEQGLQVGQSGYLMAIVLALITAWFSSPTALLVVSLASAVAFYFLSRYEQRPLYVYAEAASFYLAIMQPVGIYNMDYAYTSVFFLAAGLVIYALGVTESDPVRAKALRYSGMVGPFIGALLNSPLQRVEPVAALAGGGVLLVYEGMRGAKPVVAEAGGAVLVLALNWLCRVIEIDETQVYTLPWAAYLAFLAWRRRAKPRESYDGWVAFALGVLTIPLAGQALASDGQVYGLILILEAIALVFLGMALNYKMLTVWGAATLIIEVLYQLRDFFYALPKYFISAGLGLALLAVAIVLLLRRKGGDRL